MLRVKSVKSPIEPEADGLRVLVARFLPRGMKAGVYDVWMPSLAPSTELLNAFLKEGLDMKAFHKQYRVQLFQSEAVDAENGRNRNHGQKYTLRLLKSLSERGNVTLLCYCAEADARCHRHVLKREIEKV
ncbi:MAG: DUF488 domain-containing protein [Opitutales bacterium]